MSGVPYTFGNATTSIPLSQLDVNFATNATLGNASVSLGNTTTTVGNLTVSNVTINGLSGGGANGVIYINSSNVATANASVLALDGNGNLGLGTTPSSWGSGRLAIEMNSSIAAYLVNNNTGSLQLQNNSYYNGSVSVAKVTGAGSSYIQSQGSHYWYTIASVSAGATQTYTQAMTLDNSGNLLVGATATGTTLRVYGGTTTGAICRVGANASTFNPFQFVYDSSGGGSTSGTQVGTISCTTSSTAYNTSSDARLKNLIGVATDTSVIDNIVVNDFTWKVDGSTDRGVFAQDAIHIKPSAIHQGKDDLDEHGLPTTPWGVDYSKFVPDLIVYCQQLKKQVTELSAKVTALEAKVGV